ncbi:MAG: TspO/MBR family protein [Ilumatobacteraceae bacterium]
MSRGWVGAVSTLLVLVYAFGSGVWVSSGDDWYRSLVRPPWQPPDVVFGIIWPYNFVVVGVAGWVVASRASLTSQVVWLCSLVVSVAAALLWAQRFYVAHSLGVASVSLVVCAAVTVPLLVVAFRMSLPLGLAMVPYQVWLFLAASLSLGYAAQN